MAIKAPSPQPIEVVLAESLAYWMVQKGFTAQAHRLHAEALQRENQRLAMALHQTDTMGGETANSPAFYRA